MGPSCHPLMGIPVSMALRVTNALWASVYLCRLVSAGSGGDRMCLGVTLSFSFSLDIKRTDYIIIE